MLKQFALIIFLFVCCSHGLAQKFLAIDLYRPFGMTRLRVFPNEVLVYKSKWSSYYKKSMIADMSDSSIFFTNGESIGLDEIKALKAGRSNWLIRKTYKVGIQGGIALVVIDAFNHLINYEPEVVDVRVAKVAAGMFVTGCIIKFFCVRRIHPGKNKRLKIIDLSLK